MTFAQTLALITLVLLVVDWATRRSTKIGLKISTGVDPRLWVSVAVSAVVLSAALYIVLSGKPTNTEQEKWAFGVIGTIVGYWLHQ